MKSFGEILAARTSTVAPVPVDRRTVTNGVALSGLGSWASAGRLLGAMGANGTLYNIVSTNALSTSRVEWKLWRKARSGKKEDRVQVTSHLALDIWSCPNANSTSQLFVETFQQHVELVGEGWWVMELNEFGWPESMWVVRPDRIAPVGTEKELIGYIYTGPNGERVPLDLNQVCRIRQPNPLDPGPAGRGMGATQTILSQLEAVQFSAQWNRNFFANSAVPGGIIKVPSTLSDPAFKRLQMQWRENHQGVSNAARVAILEGGTDYTPGSNQRDMQFVELMNSSPQVIREAFGFPKFMSGAVDDVNRANAEASLAMYGGWLIEPRLDRIKDVLNYQFLPLFGPTGRGTGQPDLEWDYDSPVPLDQTAEDASLTARVDAYVKLLAAGVDPADAAELCQLPDMNVTKSVAPAPATIEEGGEGGSRSEAYARPRAAFARHN